MAALILLIALVLVATRLYRHKKGGYYIVLGTVYHSETREPLVVYVGRSGFWARPAGMFFDGRFRRCWSI